ncbi:MATE family efflux transporter [Thalassotalea ganghwensis]
MFSSLPHKQLFAIAIPMILSHITVPLLGMVDTAVIGHLEHAYYLGGSTVGATVITAIIWLSGFLRMSTTGLAAQAQGQGNTQNAQLVLVRGLLVALGIAAIAIVFQTPYIEAALYLSGGSEQVQYYAREYCQIRIYGVPAALANIVILGWLLGHQKTKAVMWILILTNLTNLLLDLLFVWQFKWQVAGVAWATLAAEYVGLFLGLISILRGRNLALAQWYQRLLSSIELILDSAALKRYFKLNRDILIRTLCLQSCFVFITFQGAKLGDEVVAANAILMNFMLLISFGLDGIANAAEVMVGHAVGSANKYRLKIATVTALFWTFIFALGYSAIFTIFGDELIRLISDIPNVVDFANQYLFWVMLLPLLACWCFLFDGIYIGLMQAKIMRNSMLISVFIGFYPLWYLFRDYQNHGLWAAFCAFMLLRGITLAWHYVMYVWPREENQAT